MLMFGEGWNEGINNMVNEAGDTVSTINNKPLSRNVHYLTLGIRNHR